MSGDSFCMVWNEARDVPRVKHDSYHSATCEAERLARINPGQTFYVLVATDAFAKEDVKRTKLEMPIPF